MLLDRKEKEFFIKHAKKDIDFLIKINEKKMDIDIEYLDELQEIDEKYDMDTLFTINDFEDAEKEDIAELKAALYVFDTSIKHRITKLNYLSVFLLATLLFSYYVHISSKSNKEAAKYFKKKIIKKRDEILKRSKK